MNHKAILAAAGLAGAAALIAVGLWRGAETAQHSLSGVSMDTTVTQTALGPRADAAMKAVQSLLADYEDRCSMYLPDSEISAVNVNAGVGPVKVSDEVYDLVRRSLELSTLSDGAFQITIAPLTELWGITTDSPHVPSQAEIDAVLPLIGDSTVVLDDGERSILLPAAGQAIDLGGIAKGHACDLAKQVYEQYGVSSAILNIGGNVYVRGRKADGSRYRVGFRTPQKDAVTYIASLELEDQVMAVSGGYERYFVQDGVTYQHILSPATGYPAESDIVSVGVISADGTQADFLSTTLYIWGVDRTIDYMKQSDSAAVVMLTDDGRLIVSDSLRESFTVNSELCSDPVTFIAAG